MSEHEPTPVGVEKQLIELRETLSKLASKVDRAESQARAAESDVGRLSQSLADLRGRLDGDAAAIKRLQTRGMLIAAVALALGLAPWLFTKFDYGSLKKQFEGLASKARESEDRAETAMRKVEEKLQKIEDLDLRVSHIALRADEAELELERLKKVSVPLMERSEATLSSFVKVLGEGGVLKVPALEIAGVSIAADPKENQLVLKNGLQIHGRVSVIFDDTNVFGVSKANDTTVVMQMHSLPVGGRKSEKFVDLRVENETGELSVWSGVGESRSLARITGPTIQASKMDLSDRLECGTIAVYDHRAKTVHYALQYSQIEPHRFTLWERDYPGTKEVERVGRLMNGKP